MEFNPDNDTYLLTREETALLGVPKDAREWPNANAEELLSYVDDLERRIVADTGRTPSDSLVRKHVEDATFRRARVVREARHLIATHMTIELSDDDVAGLTGGEDL